jgi:lysozyme
MLAALEQGDYETAAKEMLDSKWARQVGDRANRLAKMMEDG